jgi:hypothetical protein
MKRATFTKSQVGKPPGHLQLLLTSATGKDAVFTGVFTGFKPELLLTSATGEDTVFTGVFTGLKPEF